MKSASKGDVLKGHLQVPHVHVLLVASLGASHMAQLGTDQHKGRITVRETAHYTSAAADLPVQPLNRVYQLSSYSYVREKAGRIYSCALLLNPHAVAKRFQFSRTVFKISFAMHAASFALMSQ